MATLLYITCNIKPAWASRSLTLGEEFLKSYSRLNPEDRIDVIDTYRDGIQRFDEDVIKGLGKLRHGDSLVSLNDEEQSKVLKIWAAADKFAVADKYVFVTPMWNLGFPAELKMYIDTICIVGKTFKYTEAGAVGLLGGQGKKCLHIHSSGGYHHGKPNDHSVPYLKSIMSFMGIENFSSVVLEGVDAEPHKEEEYTAKALEKVKRTAETF